MLIDISPTAFHSPHQMVEAVFKHDGYWRLYAFGKLQPALQSHVPDILQEFYIKCYKKWDKIPRDKPVHFLYRMLSNEITGYFRRRKPTPELMPHQAYTPSQCSLEDASFQDLLQSTLETLEPHLSDEDYTIIWHKAHGYDSQTIAELLGLSAKAVDLRTHRIRKRIRLFF